MFKILKDILTSIRGLKKPHWGWNLANMILVLLTAVGTIALAWASLKSIGVMKDNIKVTKEIADRTWRPEVYYTFPQAFEVDSLESNSKGEILYAIKNVTWGNSGGSPALEFRYTTRRDRSTKPLFDTCYTKEDLKKDTTESTRTLRPRETDTRDLQFLTRRLSPYDTTYLHIIVWYKDRAGSNYLEETIYYLWVDKKGNFSMMQRKLHDLDWATNTWL